MDTSLNRLLSGSTAFCLIQPQDSDELLVLTGTPFRCRSLAEIPRRHGRPQFGRIYDTISIVPFSQIREKDYAAWDEGEQILGINITDQSEIPLNILLNETEPRQIVLENGIHYDETAEEYAGIIERVLRDEIGNGEGANFVIPRTARGRITDFSITSALTIFRSLVANDYGTYWKFLLYDGDRVFVGSTPERHLSVSAGTVRMNPISGTFRKNAASANRTRLKRDLLAFINDRKEINELFMVVDEELKMMARMCEKGGTIIGPLLKEMSRLIHSEYLLSGRSNKDIMELFRDSMFAATVVGSPVGNACNIIKKYTSSSRRYYGSALLLIGRDEYGDDFLDSPITIRTAEIEADGSLSVSVGATLIKDSLPDEEVRETESKAAALLDCILQSDLGTVFPPLLPRLSNDDDIVENLLRRNEFLSHFWFFNQAGPQAQADNTPRQLKLTLIHNDDDFIFMLRHIFNALRLKTAIIPYTEYDIEQDTADITLIGPGPGNPNADDSTKIAINMDIAAELLRRKRPLICICLGHQILCKILGYSVEKLDRTRQGSQEIINLFGTPEMVGFYNTFAPKVAGHTDHCHEISILEDGDELIAIRGAGFVSFQFHPESVLSQNGCAILGNAVAYLMSEGRYNHSGGTPSINHSPYFKVST